MFRLLTLLYLTFIVFSVLLATSPSLAAAPATCQNKVLEKNIVAKGILQNIECPDELCDMDIKLPNGSVISIYADEASQAKKIFGKAQGQMVYVNFDVLQIWSDSDKKCSTFGLVKDGKVASVPGVYKKKN